MAHWDLKIELDRADRMYRAGEEVRGRLLVRTYGNIVNRGVGIRWRCEVGDGTTDLLPQSSLRESLLHDGSLMPDEDHVLPFAMPSPEGPLSFEGELVYVRHTLEAYVDLKGARDTTTSSW